jgi:hypothetical protein
MFISGDEQERGRLTPNQKKIQKYKLDRPCGAYLPASEL